MNEKKLQISGTSIVAILSENCLMLYDESRNVEYTLGCDGIFYKIKQD